MRTVLAGRQEQVAGLRKSAVLIVQVGNLFEHTFAVNLRTARTLGLELPPAELCGNLGDGAVRRRAALTS